MLWLVLLLVVGPLAELWVAIQVAQVIGGWEALGLLLLSGLVGGWLVKRQGRVVVRRIDERLRRDELPTRELADGFLLLVAGVLMLVPGFLTDVVGFALLLPPTRALARVALLARFTARMGRGLTFVSVRRVGGFGSRRGGEPFLDTTATERSRSHPGTTALGSGDRPR